MCLYFSELLNGRMPLNLLLIMIVGLSSWALDEQTLLKPFPEKPLLNEIVAFEPVENHHFNLKSKNSCGRARIVNIAEDRVECQMHKAGETQLELFICDDKQSYCRREEVKVSTPSPEGLLNWGKYYWNSWFAQDKWQAPFKNGVSALKPARGFLLNDVEKAIFAAQTEDKPILIYFTQSSCAPCRLMKEMTFATNDFQDIAKKVVLLQIDIDLDIAPEKMKPIPLKATPTMVLVNKDFQELDRRTGTISNLKFKQWLMNFKSSTKPVSEVVDDVDALKKNLLDIKNQNYIDYEKLRALYWPSENDDHKKVVKLIHALDRKADVVEIDTFMRVHMSRDAENPFKELAQIPYKSLRCEGMALPELASVFADQVIVAIKKQDHEQIKNATKELEEIQSYIGTPAGDPLQCSYLQLYLISVKQYLATQVEDLVKQKLVCAEKVKLLSQWPRTAGVTDISQLELEKSECAEDQKIKQKITLALKEKNVNDYGYDFLDASQAMMEKKYDLALQKVEESLKVAKDRGWQKAFLLKMDILKAMGQKDQAQQEVDQVLKQLDLPASDLPKIHRFAQNLRKKQAELK